jgi:hypothetical protein
MLRKRLAKVPSERVPVVVGSMSALRLIVLKNDDWPVTPRVPDALTADDEKSEEEKRLLDTVTLVPEAFKKYSCPPTVRALVVEALPTNVVVPVTVRLVSVVVAREVTPERADNDPVKFAALDMVCPLIRPEVTVPIFVRLRDASMICVPLSCSTVEAPEKLTRLELVFRYELPIVPILTRLPDTSIRCVPAPAPVLMPVVPLSVVPVIVLAVAIVPKPEAIDPDVRAPVLTRLTSVVIAGCTAPNTPVEEPTVSEAAVPVRPVPAP